MKGARSTHIWVAAFCVLGSGNALAQTTPPNPANEAARNSAVIQARELARSRELLEQAKAVNDVVPNGTSVKREIAASTAIGCSKVDTLNVRGVSVYRPRVITRLTRNLTGACVPNDRIDNAIRDISNKYLADGYVTSRAYFETAELPRGILTIVVVEGKINDVRASGTPAYTQRQLNQAFPTRRGTPLNLRRLEQGVDQLSRLTYAEPSIEIVAGQAAQTSDVVVKRQGSGRRVRPTASVNNNGSASTGRLQGSVGLVAENPLGLIDYWIFNYSRSLESTRGVNNQAGFGYVSIPYGYWTLGLSASASDYNSVLRGNEISFANSGRNWSTNAELERVVFRNAASKVSVAGVVSVQDTQNSIRGIRLQSGSYRVATIGVRARGQRRLAKAVVGFDAGVTRGINAFGARSINTGPQGPTILGTVIDVNGYYQSAFELAKRPMTFATSVRGQAGLDALFPAQRFTIGGDSTVRGFSDDSVSGRSGIFTRQQLSTNLATFEPRTDWMPSSLSAYIGHDAGQIIKNDDDIFERGFLQSVSLGLGFKSEKMRADLYVARPLAAPDFITKDDYQVSANIQFGF
jgi:hemolysin activation/secretion protein